MIPVFSYDLSGPSLTLRQIYCTALLSLKRDGGVYGMAWHAFWAHSMGPQRTGLLMDKMPRFLICRLLSLL